MCGINGFCDFNKQLQKEDIEKANELLRHRGPDDGETVVFQTPDAHIGLGHRRLSILDLSSLGHQPMYSDDKQVVIILNGEIYNFKEIRCQLEGNGHRFISNSDTEVIVKAYLQYGIECVQQFIGMFAFVIYDMRLQKIFLCRDRAGVKPLYYYFANGCLLFASELKAFHQYKVFKKEIEPKAVSLFLSYGYIKEPYSIFKNTHKLSPGHYAILDISNQQLQLHQYWNVLDYYNKPVIDIGEEEATDHLEKLLTSAFEYRMVSDVPVGVFLSGGYDSSLVSAILQKNSMNKIKTFTIGFNEDKYNEAEHAKAVAHYLGTDHHEYYCSTKEALEIIPTLPYFYDEPFGDSSAIPTILVSRFARQQVTVALSADAGDEMFAGYGRYDQLVKIKKIKQYIPSFLARPSSKILQQLPVNNPRYAKLGEILSAETEVEISDNLSRHFTRKQVNALLNTTEKFKASLIDLDNIPLKSDFINTVLAADYKTYLADDILTKVDRATMSAGLEGREPFLDQRIVEWAAQLPSSLKYNKGNKKYLLKKLTHRYLPEKIMDRPKMGFGIPINKWLRGELKPLVMDIISRKNLQKHNLLNEDAVISLRDNYLTSSESDTSQLWLLLMFQMWWNQWME
jgi:asparagine synthase (glutamine-hydrolysing)